MRAVIRAVAAAALAAVATGAIHAVPARAQTDIPVCHTQQQLEQLIRDKGKVLPDGCRRVRITEVHADVGRLCLIDMTDRDPGLVGSVVNAATDTRWWTQCSNLGRH